MDFNEECINAYFDYVYHFIPKDEKVIERFIESLNDLTEQETAVICYRHGLIDGESKSLNKVAEFLGINVKTVQEVEASATKKLRHSTRRKKLEETNDDKNFVITNKDYLPDGITFADIYEKMDRQK